MYRRLLSSLLAVALATPMAVATLIVLPGSAAAETEVVCPRQEAVPAGWIHTDSYYTVNFCGSGPFPPQQVTQWQITRYDNAFRDDHLVVCVNAPLPAGWADQSHWVEYGRCGLRFGVDPPPNVKIIKCLNCPLRPPPPPTPTPSWGGIDQIFPTGLVAGVAVDPGAPGSPDPVHFYLDGPPGTKVGETVANIPRADVGPHTFAWTLPPTAFDDQEHTLRAYGIDLNPGQPNTLIGTKTFRLPNRPIGNLDGIDAQGTVSGWSLDPNLQTYATANQVLFTVDGFHIGAPAVADLPRPDIAQNPGYPGNHGFRWSIPFSLRDGQYHTLTAIGVDLTGQENRELTGGPLTFRLDRPKAPVDVDADRRSDIGVWRPGSGDWWLRSSSTGADTTVSFGQQAGDRPVPADYDGDRRTDVAVFRGGVWHVQPSAGGDRAVTSFGLAGDLPVPGDYDGDGRADLAVLRPAENIWYVRPSTGDGGYYGIPFGQAGDKPVPADYTGDGRTDMAVFRPLFAAWFVRDSATGQTTVRQFGVEDDLPVPADYDGDTRADIAVFRPAQGTWWVHRSLDDKEGPTQWGMQGDLPAPADYDGDGLADLTVFRPAEGNWYQALSRTGARVTARYGLAGDVPIAGAALPG